MATRPRARRIRSLTDLRHLFRVDDRGSGQMVAFVVGTGLFFASASVLVHFVAEPPGGTSGLENRNLNAAAGSALDLLLRGPGFPADWTGAPDELTRLGLLDAGRTVRIDPAKFEAVARGSLTASSRENGWVDYDEAREALGLQGYDFHLRSWPIFRQDSDNAYGVEGMENFHVAYIGDFDRTIIGGIPNFFEEGTSRAERGGIAELPVRFRNLTRTTLLALGDVYPDTSDVLRSALVPQLGGTPVQTVISQGSGNPKHNFARLEPEAYASYVPLHTASRALGLAADDDALGYAKSRELRTILGVANLTGLPGAWVEWAEWVNTSGLTSTRDADDYGWVEVSPDGGQTWYAITNDVIQRSQDSPTYPHSPPGGMRLRNATVNALNCGPCLGAPEVHVALHWRADGDDKRGFGWIVDDFKVTPTIDTGLHLTFERPEYDMVIIGSNADQSAFTSAEVKFALRDYVIRHGGRLVVLGGQQNTQWLEPIFKVGISSGSPGIASPDVTHPLLTVPNQLQWSRYDHGGKVWKFNDKPNEDLFALVVGTGPGEHVLSASQRGAFGSDESEGSVVLTTYLPFKFDKVERHKFFANVITYGRYHRLYLELGPPVPEGIPVGSAVRTGTMDKTAAAGNQMIDLGFILYLWGGDTRASTVTSTSRAPLAPADLGVSWEGSGHVKLSWVPPDNPAPMPPILSYSIYRGSAPDTETLLASVPGNSTFDDLTVTDGVTYFYVVRAHNAVGEGPLSNSASITPFGPPSPPVSPQAIPILDDIGLGWAPPASNGGSAITSYRIYGGLTSGNLPLLAEIGSNLSYLDVGVGFATTKYYQIAAVNGLFEGARSVEFSAGTVSGPLPPAGLVAVSPGWNKIDLVWAAADPNSGPDVTSYKVYRGTAPGTLALYATLGSVTSWTNADLPTGSTFYYTVSALSAAGESATSNQAFATVLGNVTPTAPLALVVDRGTNATHLNWTAPASNGGTPVLNYRIYAGSSPGALALLATIGPTATYTHTGLAPNATWHYEVSAMNAVGESARSNGASATTRSVPWHPLTLVATTALASGAGKIELIWTLPANDGGSSITGYAIYRGTTPGSLTLVKTVGNTLTDTQTGLTAGVTYYFRVAAINTIGLGTQSPVASAAASLT